MHAEMVMPQDDMPESYTIRTLDDGSFLFEGDKGGEHFEYSYRDVDELLSDLKDDLTSGKKKTEEPIDETSSTRKSAMDKIMKGNKEGM